MRRRVLGVVMVGLLAAGSAAEALTVRDIVELSRAGLGEEVLIALIDVDRGVYAIDTATLKMLKEAGVSERVIVAMVRSGRERPPVPEPPPPVVEQPEPPPAQVVVIERAVPEVQQVVVPVPVYVPVPTPRFRTRHDNVRTESTFVPFQSGPPAERPTVEESRRPVYWGFGGQRRPDTWDQTPREKKR